MTLSASDKRFLSGIGHSPKDIQDISFALKKTIFTITIQGHRVPIPAEEAIDILGRELFLKGIAWSTFHYTCRRENTEGKEVHFDSSHAWS